MWNNSSSNVFTWEDWRHFCEVFSWIEEEVKRHSPEKLCGWALDSLNYLTRVFWKPDQQKCAWTPQETLYLFDVRVSNFPQSYVEAFDRYFMERKNIKQAFLQCEKHKPLFQGEIVDRNELATAESTKY